MSTIAEDVTKLIAAHLGVAEADVTPEKQLQELGADSLDSVEIVMGIEDEFNLEIPDEDAQVWKTVGDIHRYVEGRKPVR